MAPERTATVRDVIAVWVPLWLSWALMGLEQPSIAGVIARMPHPELSLAAYGGIVYPLALMIEAPIIMLLSASTELSRDRASHRALQTFTHRAGAILTLLHLAIAATPLYDVLTERVFAVPAEVAAEARPGLLLMLPWTWAIAWRRHGQGVLIRFGHSRSVVVGTMIRLTTTALSLALGVWVGSHGVVVGASALAMGVLAEAVFVAIKVRPIVRANLHRNDPNVHVLRGAAFLRFYVPLAMMPVVSLIIQPAGTAAIARMPNVVESLAIWPVVIGVVFLLQTPGLALAEVSVAMMDRPGGREALRQFVLGLCVVVGVATAAIAFTPLASLWFGKVVALAPGLVGIAAIALTIDAPIPMCRVLQSWHQGRLVFARRTRPVSEAVLVFGCTCVLVLCLGVRWQANGVYAASLGFTLGRVAQTLWIAVRAQHV